MIYFGSEFTGESLITKNAKLPMIPKGSQEESIVADGMEMNLGISATTAMVNQHRLERGQCLVSRSAAFNSYHGLNPVVRPVKKRAQGNDDNVQWKNARYLQTKQMCVMTGLLSKEDIQKDCHDKKIPDCFNHEKLPTVEIQK